MPRENFEEFRRYFFFEFCAVKFEENYDMLLYRRFCLSSAARRTVDLSLHFSSDLGSSRGFLLCPKRKEEFRRTHTMHVKQPFGSLWDNSIEIQAMPVPCRESPGWELADSIMFPLFFWNCMFFPDFSGAPRTDTRFDLHIVQPPKNASAIVSQIEHICTSMFACKLFPT